MYACTKLIPKYGEGEGEGGEGGRGEGEGGEGGRVGGRAYFPWYTHNNGEFNKDDRRCILLSFFFPTGVSPFTLTVQTPGQHRLVIRPDDYPGCNKRRRLRVDFII